MNTAQAQQFATLQKGTATYKNDTKMADHMRRKEADLMSRAIEKNRRDEEELRAVHGEVGEESRKQKNLDMERKRLKEVMECDKLAIQKITQELKIIEVCLLRRRRLFVTCYYLRLSALAGRDTSLPPMTMLATPSSLKCLPLTSPI